MVNILTDRLVLSDYPNLLLEPVPKRLSLPLRPLLLAGLVLICILPRALISIKCTGVCPDATLYLKLAKSMEAGEWHPDLIPLQIAAYPAIISMLHRVGFGWESGAQPPSTAT